ncbi:hypothetical protein EON65_15960 [archaeon]|nr:MAG: hypothetical protein EON65_15960 [archaeon]
MSTNDPLVDDPSSQNFINGFNVRFPAGRKPFPAQFSVISKVLQALKDTQNALLESPTGTGKVGLTWNVAL